MTPELAEAGYIQTKAKLADLMERRSRIAVRVDLSPTHRSEVLRSHDRMIGQYRREIKLYEAARASARESAKKSPVQYPTSSDG
jgi:hypothetical protein